MKIYSNLPLLSNYAQLTTEHETWRMKFIQPFLVGVLFLFVFLVIFEFRSVNQVGARWQRLLFVIERYWLLDSCLGEGEKLAGWTH